MSTFQLTALFLSVVALGAWANARTLKLPHGVAMLLAGLAGAGALATLNRLAPGLPGVSGAFAAVSGIDFSQTVLGYMLAFLLFAGAMQVDLSELRRRLLSVFTLATVGVGVSTIIVGLGVWLVAGWLGEALTLPWALVFGALISPTDPIAVLATVRHGNLSKALQAVLQGEALFNDGVGIVVFTALVAFASGGAPDPGQALLRVFVQAAGGLALGAVAGIVVVRAMRAIDDFVAEAALSVALAMGVFALAQAVHLSGPIAVVGAGLLVGDVSARGAMSEATQAYLQSFWTLVDEILNALLFFLLGLQLLVVRFDLRQGGIWIAAILLVLAARWAVVLPWGSFLHMRREQRGATVTLTWGGLHGALSLALALSVPPGPHRPLILAITFVVVTFSIAVQGLTFAPLAAAVGRTRSGTETLTTP